MSFLTGLFGGGDNLWLTVSVALALVLVLIVLAIWLLKMIFTATSKATRGRNRRLGLVDTLPLDQKRQLLLIRRDGVEHLILAGGTHDLVVETNIVPPEPATERPARRSRPEAQPVATQPVPAQPSPARTVHPAPQPVDADARTAPRPGASPTISPEDRPVADAPAKRGASLRYTGLLRPVSRMEPAFIPTPDEKSPPRTDDSDMNSSDTNADMAHADPLRPANEGAAPLQDQHEDAERERKDYPSN